MTWNPNSNKHKAMHGGYRQKPSKKTVSVLLDMYSSCSKVQLMPVRKKQVGVQLKLNL